MKQLRYGFKFNNTQYSLTKGLYYCLCPIFERVQEKLIKHKVTVNQLRKMNFDYIVTYVKPNTPGHIMFVLRNDEFNFEFDTVASMNHYQNNPQVYLGIDQTEIAKRYTYTDSHDRSHVIQALNTLINADRTDNDIVLSKINRVLNEYRTHLINWAKHIMRDLAKSQNKPKLPSLVSNLKKSPTKLTLKSSTPQLAQFPQNELFCVIYKMIGRGFSLYLAYKPDKSKLLDTNIQLSLPLDFDVDQLTDVINILDNLQTQNSKFINDKFPELK